MEVTPRQHDVILELLFDGADNATIARRLKIKEGTVNDHMKAIYRRAPGLNGRIGLVIELMSGRLQMVVVDKSEPLK